MGKPLVSVICFVYNHEKFLREALEGFVMQKTTFSIEVIIHDDASTDSSALIIKDYEEKYPEIIKPIYQTINQCSLERGRVTRIGFNQAKGKYIALCEGDDYWTDPLKLQKQVDFLEANDDYNICFHNVELFLQKENCFKKDTITREVNAITTVKDLAKGNYIHTPSVIMRNNFKLPTWISKSPIGDWALYMFVIKDKKVKKMNDVMAVYRVSDSGVWSGKSKKYRVLNTIKAYDLVINSGLYSKEVKKVLIKTRIQLKSQLKHKGGLLTKILKRIRG